MKKCCRTLGYLDCLGYYFSSRVRGNLFIITFIRQEEGGREIERGREREKGRHTQNIQLSELS